MVSNIFFYGKSDAKLFGFLIYFAVLLLGILLRSSNSDSTTCRAHPKVFWIWVSVLILSSLNLVSYFYYVIKFNLDIRTFPVFVSRGNFEGFSQLIHIHTLKPALSWPLNYFGITDLQGYGDGLIFFSYLPLFYIVSSVILVGLFVLMVQKGWSLDRKEKPFFLSLVLFAISSFGVIKALIDGGPLNNEFILSAVFLHMFMHARSQEHGRKVTIEPALKAVLYLSIFYFVYYRFFLEVSDLGRIFHLLTPIWSTFCLLSFLFLLCLQRKLKLHFVLLLCLGLALQYDSSTVSEINYHRQKIPKKSKVIITSSKSLPYPVLYTGPTLSSYFTYSQDGTELMDYIYKHGLRFQYYPIMVDGFNCTLDSVDLYWADVLVIEGKPELGPKLGGASDYIKYSNFSYVSTNVYSMQAHIKGCHPAVQHVLAQELLLRGVDLGVIIRRESPISILNVSSGVNRLDNAEN